MDALRTYCRWLSRLHLGCGVKMKRLLTFFATAIATLLIAGLFAVLMIEWMAGCGETYIDAKGVRHQYECVFIPQPTERN